MSTVLGSQDWLERRDRHRRRVSTLLEPYVRQRVEGRSNPVVDFLFAYYSLTPGQLRWWHPGFGVTLTGPESREYENRRGYCRTDSGVTVDPEHLSRRRPTVEALKVWKATTPQRGHTVKSYVTEHLDALSGVEKKTVAEYRRYLVRDIEPVLGHIQLSTLSRTDISKWVNKLQVIFE